VLSPDKSARGSVLPNSSTAHLLIWQAALTIRLHTARVKKAIKKLKNKFHAPAASAGLKCARKRRTEQENSGNSL
jgi:hypothetical protein